MVLTPTQESVLSVMLVVVHVRMQSSVVLVTMDT